MPLYHFVERTINGVECVSMLCLAASHYYDSILMDIQMPHLDEYGTPQDPPAERTGSVFITPRIVFIRSSTTMGFEIYAFIPQS